MAAAAVEGDAQSIASVRLMLEALAEKGRARPRRLNSLPLAFHTFKKMRDWSDGRHIVLMVRPNARP